MKSLLLNSFGSIRKLLQFLTAVTKGSQYRRRSCDNRPLLCGISIFACLYFRRCYLFYQWSVYSTRMRQLPPKYSMVFFLVYFFIRIRSIVFIVILVSYLASIAVPFSPVFQINDCSHRVCIDHFYESLVNFNQSFGIRCYNYGQYLQRVCDCRDTVPSGFYTPKTWVRRKLNLTCTAYSKLWIFFFTNK